MTSPPRPSLWQRVLRLVRPPVRHAAVFEGVLGTTLDLQLLAGTQAQARQAETAVLAEIDRLEQVFSRFLPQSELNRWLHSQGPTPVSPELGQVLAQALKWTQLSGGAFHPATEALSARWRQAEQAGETQAGESMPPDVQPLLEQMRQPLYTVQERGGRWEATRLTELPLGFNAFAKGFIADRAAEAGAAVPGVHQLLVNLGGDLRVLGPQPVRVAIADPSTVADNAAPLTTVQVQGQGLATSGRARRGFRVGGRWYSHVLDPRTGRPVGGTVSASVIAGSSARADVLATIFSVLDPPASIHLADRLPDVACLLVDDAGRIHTSARWPGLVPASPVSPSGTPPSEVLLPSEVRHDHPQA